MKYESTLLAQDSTPFEIQKADLDLLKKINEVAVGDIVVNTITDLDSLSKSVAYKFNSTAVGAPSISSAYTNAVGLSIISESKRLQIANINSADGLLWRTYDGSSWSEWHTIIDNLLTKHTTVYAYAYRLTSVTPGTNLPIAWEGVYEDTHNAITLANGRFTAPMDGLYNISGYAIRPAAGNSLVVWKNGAGYITLTSFVGNGYSMAYSATIRLAKDDYIDIRVDGSVAITSIRAMITRVGS